MFMVPGSHNVVRVNGTAVLSADPTLTGSFEQGGKHPRTVIVMQVEELYFQCAKALLRSGLWSGKDESDQVPSAGQLIREADEKFDAEGYDDGYAEYAKPIMW